MDNKEQQIQKGIDLIKSYLDCENSEGGIEAIKILESLLPKSEPVAPIDKTLTAEQYIRRLYPLSDKFSRLGCEKIAESYANLRVEQAKEEWEKEKQLLLNKLQLITEICDQNSTVNQHIK